MSIAVAIPGPIAVYREDQLFGWWIYALMALMAATACGFILVRPEAHDGRIYTYTIGIIVGLTLPIVLTVGVLRMTTLVSPGRVDVWFGWIPSYRRAIPIEAIHRVEVVTYRPLADYGGWGIRVGRDGERLLNARGNRGVRLIMADGSRILIGSQHPEALAGSLERLIHPGV